MKIALVVRAHWPVRGGAEVYQHIVASLLSKKHDVRVLAQICDDRKLTIEEQTVFVPSFQPYKDDQALVYSLAPSIVGRLLLSPFLFYERLYYRTPIVSRYKQLIKRVYLPIFWAGFGKKIAVMTKGIDIIHSFNGEFLGWAAYMVAKRNNIPYVMTPQVHPGWWLDDEFNLRLYRSADAIFAALETERKFYLNNGVDARKVHVIGNVFELSPEFDARAFRVKYGINEGRMVLFLGAKRLYKGYKALLEATDMVWREFPHTCFVFMGPRTGPKTQEATAIFSQYNDPRIIEIENASLEEKTSGLAATDILCVPSISESFGMVFLEAWMFEKPVIAGNIPTLRELVRNGEEGLVVDQIPRAIGEAVTRLLRDESLCRRLGRAGKRKVLENYMPEKVVSKIETVYKMLCRK